MEKRKLIMEKALELFAEQGFTATSIQEITERSGISKGAFYLSFKSKDELILALIHQFLQEYIADLDRIVSESDPDDLIHRFYHYQLESFSEKSDFAKIFMKEQVQFLNEGFFAQILGYNGRIQSTILKMLEKKYGEMVKETKYDLVYGVQGLLNSYMELILFGNLSIDIKPLAKSMVEKTDILAKYMTLPVVTEDVYQLLRKPAQEAVTDEYVREVMDETIAILDDPLEKESLLLLRDELDQPSQPKAVVAGLIKNIENHPSCKRVSYLLKTYWDD